MITTKAAQQRIAKIAPSIRRALSTADGCKAFSLGVREFRSDLTTNPGEDLIEAYDTGREFAHVVTLGRFAG